MTSTPPPSTPAGVAGPTDEDAPAQPVSASVAADSDVVAESLGEYISAWSKRVRAGESGVLPVLAGFVVIIIVFQLEKSVFLSSGNIVNLLVQGATFVLLGMAEVFVLLLGDIDLSLGFSAAVGAVITVGLSAPPHNMSWPISVAAGLATTTLFGGPDGVDHHQAEASVIRGHVGRLALHAGRRPLPDPQARRSEQWWDDRNHQLDVAGRRQRQHERRRLAGSSWLSSWFWSRR